MSDLFLLLLSITSGSILTIGVLNVVCFQRFNRQFKEYLEKNQLKLFSSDWSVQSYFDSCSLFNQLSFLLHSSETMMTECCSVGQRCGAIVPVEWDLLPPRPRKKGHKEYCDSFDKKEITLLEREEKIDVHCFDCNNSGKKKSTGNYSVIKNNVQNQFRLKLKDGVLCVVELNGHSLDLSLKNGKVILYRSNLRNVKIKLDHSEAIIWNSTVKQSEFDLDQSKISVLNSSIRDSDLSAVESELEFMRVSSTTMNVKAQQSMVKLQELFFYKKLILKLKEDCCLEANLPNLTISDCEELQYSDLLDVDLEEKSPIGDPKTFVLKSSDTKGTITNHCGFERELEQK